MHSVSRRFSSSLRTATFGAVGAVLVCAIVAQKASATGEHPLDKACRLGNAGACCQRLMGPETPAKTPATKKTAQLSVHLTGSAGPQVTARSLAPKRQGPVSLVVKAAPGTPLLVVAGPSDDAMRVLRARVGKSGTGALVVSDFVAERARLFSSGICKTTPDGLSLDPSKQRTPSNRAAAKTQQPTDPKTLARGRALYEQQCLACHSLDGKRRVGPSFKGLAGQKVELADGTHVIADSAYLRASMTSPMKAVRKGYPAAMPPFKGSEQDLDALVMFIQAQHD